MTAVQTPGVFVASRLFTEHHTWGMLGLMTAEAWSPLGVLVRVFRVIPGGMADAICTMDYFCLCFKWTPGGFVQQISIAGLEQGVLTGLFSMFRTTGVGLQLKNQMTKYTNTFEHISGRGYILFCSKMTAYTALQSVPTLHMTLPRTASISASYLCLQFWRNAILIH